MNESFEWCNGCKEYDTEQHCCHRFSKAIYSHIIEAYQSGYEDGKDAGYTEGLKEGKRGWTTTNCK